MNELFSAYITAFVLFMIFELSFSILKNLVREFKASVNQKPFVFRRLF